MAIQDICYERLVNLHQPGGESTLFSDKKITLKFIRGSLFNDSSNLEGVITNLSLSSKAVLDPICVEKDCVAGEGIWTTALITNISRNNNGVTEYWVAGSLDSEGNVWVLNLGIIDPATGDFIIKDENVSINTKGYFKSRIPLPQGIKLAVLKKITYSEVDSVLHAFGEYRNNRKITRSKVGTLLEYNAEDQQSDLDLISIGLINLIFSTYKASELNTTKYFIKGELDFYIRKIIEDNLLAISDLIDFKSTSRRINSIPKTLTTYLTPDLLYNDQAYLDNIARCVDLGCVDSDCLVSKPVFVTSSREVSTKSIAWFYLLVYTYSLYLNNNQYTYLLDLLAFYLVNQISKSNNLPTKGWTHADILEESTEIIEYDLSTAVITYIVLLKHYNYTSNSTYLELATNIEEAIWSNFYNFKFKLFTPNTVEELSYGLLFSNLVDRADVVESILTYIENNLTTDYGVIKESINGISIINLNKLSSASLTSVPSNLNFTKLNNPETTLLGISEVNLLLNYSIQLSQANNYSTSLKLQQHLTTFLNTLNAVEITNTLPYVCSCISNTSIFNLEVIAEGDYRLTSNLSFERNFTINKLLDLPTEFGWFSKKALQFTGNIYKIFNSVSKIISTFSVYGKDIITNNHLSSLKGFRLTNYLSFFKMSRLPQELDTQTIDYFSSVFGGKEDKITSFGITKKLIRHNVFSLIEEPYNNIIKINSTKNNTKLGESYIIGNNYSSVNIVEVTVLQPVNTFIITELSKSLPIATKCLLNEVILIESSLIESQCLLVEESNNNNFYFLLESINSNVSNLLNEDSTKLVIEGV